MNWNGGTLPRASKNAKASLSMIQKRHFAKARGKLQNGLPSSPNLDFSLFETEERAETKSYEETSGHRAVSRARVNRKDHQRTLDEFGSVVPLGRHLGSIKPRQRYRRRGCSSHVKIEGYREQEDRLRTRSPLPAHLKPHPSSASTFKLVPSNSRESSKEAPQLSAADILEAKKRELLGTRDWVGLNSTKPVHMKFAGVKDRDLIGKRRSLEGRGYLTRNGGDEKRMRTAHSQKKGSTPLRVLERDASPTDISIRIGSLKSGSKQRESKNLYHCSEKRGSISEEEMLLDPETPAKSGIYKNLEHHVYSQGLRSPQLAIKEQTLRRLSPAIGHTSSVSQARSTLRSAASGNEGQLGMLASQILAGSRGGQSMVHIVHTPRFSRRTRADEDAELRLFFDHLPKNSNRNCDSSETAIIDTPTVSTDISDIKATLCATSASAKRRKAAVGDQSITLEPEIKGSTRYQSPLGNAVLAEVDEQENPLNFEPNVEDISIMSELHTQMSGEQPVGYMDTVEKADPGAVQDEQNNFNQVVESTKPTIESSQDEETLWRDFVFGHDYRSGEDAIDGLESHTVPIQDGHDKSSMIAEFDFEEASFPKINSLRTGSSVVVEASQISSASCSAVLDLPFVPPQASDSSMETQQLISDPSSDDPLAWTPGRFKEPKVIFKKPSKYRGKPKRNPSIDKSWSQSNCRYARKR